MLQGARVGSLAPRQEREQQETERNAGGPQRERRSNRGEALRQRRRVESGARPRRDRLAVQQNDEEPENDGLAAEELRNADPPYGQEARQNQATPDPAECDRGIRQAPVSELGIEQPGVESQQNQNGET